MNYQIFKLDEHSWMIQEGQGMVAVYMYLLEGEKKAALIDTGMGRIPLEKIVRSLTNKPIFVILTHGHFDHIGGSAAFEKVCLQKDEKDVYTCHSDCKFRSDIMGTDARAVKKDLHFMDDGDIFDLGNRTLEIISTPGHSPGSVSILDQERGWLFTGDTCCQADVLLQIEYSQSPEVYLKSVTKLIRREFQYCKTWPAHHKWPVEKEIIHQFQEAARRIVTGEEYGDVDPKSEGLVRVLSYKDIRIVYKTEKCVCDHL